MDPRVSILVVDDENGVRQAFFMLLKDNYEVILAGSGQEALAIFASRSIDLVLLDVRLPDGNGLDLLARFKDLDPQVEAIVVTPVNDTITALKTKRTGGYEFIHKPFNVDDVMALVVRALEKRRLVKEVRYLRGELQRLNAFEKMVGKHETMIRLFSQIEAVARCESTALIQGESGTGKELVARAIHNLSGRSDNPFVVINCAAIPAPLMESEIFGCNRGAFTGAHISRAGKLEVADGGTVFFDDIDCLDFGMQAKLLRVIQEREFERLGSNRVVRANVRFIAASNKDLRCLVNQQRFREDLYYRINVFPLMLPPLRVRRSDIPLLLNHFMTQQSGKIRRPSKQFSPQAMRILVNYHWPGNVRELENYVERMMTMIPEQILCPEHLPPLDDVGMEAEVSTLKEAVVVFEKRIIVETLARVNGSRKLAAAKLGIHRNTLLAKLGENTNKKQQ